MNANSLSHDTALEKKNRSLVMRLTLIVIAMFAFATLILPPLYDVFCDITGLNGKVDLTPARSVLPTSDGINGASQTTTAITQSTLDVAATSHNDFLSTPIKMQFTTKTHPSIPWIFEPLTKSISVERGKIARLDFTATNPSKFGMSGQAIPSVSPAQASPYLRKVECFCFQEQYLAAGETRIMPLQFYFTEDMPADIEEVTLSYTLYKMEK